MKNLKQVIDQTDWNLLQEQKNVLFALSQTQVGCETLPALEGILNFLDAISEAVINDGIVEENDVFPVKVASSGSCKMKGKVYQPYLEYKGVKHAVRNITYFPKDDATHNIDSLVSTDTLNKILYHDTDHKDAKIVSDALQIDNQIAFFLPSEEIVGTTPEFVLNCLNNTFPDFTFTYCDQ